MTAASEGAPGPAVLCVDTISSQCSKRALSRPTQVLEKRYTTVTEVYRSASKTHFVECCRSARRRRFDLRSAFQTRELLPSMAKNLPLKTCTCHVRERTHPIFLAGYREL